MIIIILTPQILLNHHSAPHVNLSTPHCPSIAHGRPCSVVRKSELSLEVAADLGWTRNLSHCPWKWADTNCSSLLIVGTFTLPNGAISWADGIKYLRFRYLKFRLCTLFLYSNSLAKRPVLRLSLSSTIHLLIYLFICRNHENRTKRTGHRPRR